MDHTACFDELSKTSIFDKVKVQRLLETIGEQVNQSSLDHLSLREQLSTGKMFPDAQADFNH